MEFLTYLQIQKLVAPLVPNRELVLQLLINQHRYNEDHQKGERMKKHKPEKATVFHQHTDAAGNIFGMSHPAKAVHKKASTAKAHSNGFAVSKAEGK
jgi:hypothetical protein